eukprot:CAMPEP_0172323470 /NCGR_PEP_ID=MMETSP1058-20130122/48796_1 /TAXON_ID=83371 /ORGANISM="Detonula confervacea, Strain CCMP 353" /LENGTH=617 /DNA_ID=CAMNT_0013039469 /DNA_START=62 /DNA_END=1911 /DNA_ORIENTATION=-
MTTPIQLIPRGEDDIHNINHVNGDDDDGVIENISTLNDNNANTNEPHQVHDDGDSITLSSATSATSHASTLSDGAPRPRSASLSILPTPVSSSLLLRPSSTPRQRSTPRSRPRSNPRTRTPMRHESPLLVTGNRVNVVLSDNNIVVEADSDDGMSTRNEASSASPRIGHVVVAHDDRNSGDESMIRNIFNTRRHRSRAGSIPEEVEEVIESNEASTAVNNSTEQNVQINTAAATNAPRAAGHWLARTTTTNPRSTNPTRSRHTTNNNPNALPLSIKQRPSHRKLRRWNNDRFVGTHSEHLHISLENNEGDAKSEYWREFYMPNYPCEYRSEFAKLVTDESKFGKGVRDRFLRGEVGRVGRSRGCDGEKEDDDWMEHCVVAKFQKMGIAVMPKKTMMADDQDGSSLGAMGGMGKKLFQTLSPRIQSVVSRSCALIGDDDPNATLENGESSSSFASQVVAAFESYLVSLALAGSNKDVDASNSMGYPPQQPQHVYEIFDKIFSSAPKIVMKNRQRQQRNSKHLHAVLVPTVHFYFLADDNNTTTSGGSKKKKKDKNGQEGVNRSTAFYRILLYAVCEFHGLESSSFIIAPKKKGKQQLKGQRGSGRQRGVKVVTVQGGV